MPDSVISCIIHVSARTGKNDFNIFLTLCIFLSFSAKNHFFTLKNYAFKTISSFNNSKPHWFLLGLTKYPVFESNLSKSEEQAGKGNSLRTIIGIVRRRFDRVAQIINGLHRWTPQNKF